MKYFM